MHPLLAASLTTACSTTRRAAARRSAGRQGRQARRRSGAKSSSARQCRRCARARPPRRARQRPPCRRCRGRRRRVVLVAEVDGSSRPRALDDSLASPTRSARARARQLLALRARQLGGAAPRPAAAPGVLRPHRVTSGRCCRPARRLPAPSRPGSGWRGRRRCCGAAPRATASRSRCAPRGPTRRWSSSPTPPRCARSSPRPVDVAIARGELDVPRAVRRAELDPRARRRRAPAPAQADAAAVPRRPHARPPRADRRARGGRGRALARAACRSPPTARMQALTLDIIMRVVFGAELPALRTAIRRTLDMTMSLPRMLFFSLTGNDLGFRRALDCRRGGAHGGDPRAPRGHPPRRRRSSTT